MKFVKLSWLVVFSFMIPNHLMAEINRCDGSLEPLCSAIDKLVQPSNVLGASIAITQGDGKMSYATFNKTPEGKKITPNMRFEVGSITKTFTAARILQLIDEGAIGLDTSIAEILPPTEVFFSSKIPGNLTIRNLLSMNGGLYDYVANYRVISKDLSAFWPMRNMTSGGYYPNHPKVGEHCYGSTNSLLLGLVIDKLNGGNGLTPKPLVKSYRKGLLKPAGLKNTFMGGYQNQFPISSCTNVNYFDTVENVPPQRCANPDFYLYTGNGTASNDSKTAYLSFAGPAGGMISTSGDIAKWFDWLFTEGPGQKMVESTILIGEMLPGDKEFITWLKCGQTPWPYGDPRLKKLENGYTIEIATTQYGDQLVKSYGFVGGSLTFNSYAVHLPEYGTSIAILLNNFNVPTESLPLSTTIQLYAIADIIIEHVINSSK